MIGKMILAAFCTTMSAAALAQDNTQLTNFEDTTMMLNEVTVKSSLPKTRIKGDAMSTIINGTILEKAGSCEDVLNRIPQLKTDKDGNVEVFGRGNAEVYINGRKVQDLKELSRLHSDQIKTVDVIQNPGARYAANVKAVVRIQLKKVKGDGLSFVEKADFGYRYGTRAVNNFDLNYRKSGFDVTASFSGGYNYEFKSLQENVLTYYVGKDRYEGFSNQNSTYKWREFAPQLQVNYIFNENHSIGAFYKFADRPYQDFEGMLYTDSYKNSNILERSESAILQKTTFKKHIFNAYYNGKVGKVGIDLNIDGLFDHTNEPNGTKENLMDAEGNKTFRQVDNLTQSKNRFIASKLILSYPICEGNLSIGGEYSHNNRVDAYSFKSKENLPVKATDTNIKESVSAAFMEYGRRFGILNAQVGIRYEYLNTGYYDFGKKQEDVSRKYGDWFPTASLSMPIGKMQLGLSYRKDISRPAYSDLTSSTIYINRYTYQTGNAYLKPTYTNNLVFNMSYQAFCFVVNYSHTKDVVSMRTEPYPGTDDPLLSIIHPVNAEKGYDKLIIKPSYSPTIGKWHPTWSVGFVMQNYKTLVATGDEKTLCHPYWQMVWNNDAELPCGFRLHSYARFITKGDYDNLRITKSLYKIGLGVQRDFTLKSLGSLTADFRCDDILNGERSGYTIYGIRELTLYNPGRRSFSFSLKWKFNEARSKYRGTGAGQEQKARM